MLYNYIKIGWRNLWKNKTFTFINIIGLAFGLACFLLISFYVENETSYDKFHEKSDRIYRIHTDILFGGTELDLSTTGDPMGETLMKDYPDVESYTRLFSYGSGDVKKGNNLILENNILNVDSTFFDVFSFEPISGKLENSFTEPNTAVISREIAEKYFGNLNVVGEIMTIDDNDYEITGVIEDMPANSHFHSGILLPMLNVNYPWGNFLSNNHHTYVVLKEGVDPSVFESRFKEILNNYILPQAQQYMDVSSMEEFESKGNSLNYNLIPIRDIHLHSDRMAELEVNGNISYVYIFGSIAIFILLIGCVNFMNLSTARSERRAREVGIRKVLGTNRQSLMMQFIIESIIISFFATVLAVLISMVLLPYFNDLSGKSFRIAEYGQYNMFRLFLFFPFIIGIISGLYPALYLSSFKPVAVLKSKLKVGKNSSLFRNVLVVFQFAICIVILFGTYVVYKQLNYIQHKNLGFNKDQVLIVEGTSSLGNNIQAFKNQVLQLPDVMNATVSAFLPVRSSRSDNSYSLAPTMTIDNAFNMQTWRVDENYIPTLDMKLVKGRNFYPNSQADSNSIIINETVASRIGYEDPIGKKLYYKFSGDDDVSSMTIIGVVENFHFESLKDNVDGLSLINQPSTYRTSFKVKTDDIRTLVSNVESIWTGMNINKPLNYRFMDEAFNDLYAAEVRVGKIAAIFSIIAIFIACLGLFGLVSYVAEQRTKEIGIRRVLGANINSIIQLLSRDFIRLVLIAILIAVPIGWWLMHNWLKDYAFKTSINFNVGLISSLIVAFIAFTTVALQGIKSAKKNPVDTLRIE